MAKKLVNMTRTCYFQIHIIMRFVIEGMHCIFFYNALQCMYDTTDAVFNINCIIKIIYMFIFFIISLF